VFRRTDTPTPVGNIRGHHTGGSDRQVPGEPELQLLLRRRGEPEWREPVTRRYPDEAALQHLLLASPGLVPGIEEV
jgi:hypothetical protein